MKKLYIVTGANGHLGNTIVKRLVEKGEQVRCLVLPSDNMKSLQNVNCEIYYGDVTQKSSLDEIFTFAKGTEVNVIHCAAIVSISSKKDKKVKEVNVGGVKNMLDISIERGVSKFVHVSSVHAIPEGEKGSLIKEVSEFSPDNVVGLYAKTKAEATQLVLDAAKSGKLNACVVHPSGIIGPNDYGHGHLTQMIIDYIDGRLTACVKGGYDFVDVRDVAEATINAVEHGRNGECYILSGHYMTVKNLLNELSKITGKRPIRTVLPMWLAKLTAPLSEIYYRLLKQPPLYTKYALFTLEVNSNFTHQKATHELNFNPRPLEETLKDAACWFKENGRLKVKKRKKTTQKAADKN